MMFCYFRIKSSKYLPKHCCFAWCSTQSKPAKKVKYSDTVFLPRTKFPQHLNSKQIVERDEHILQTRGFSEYYAWQSEHVEGKEFVLHDGPPYANGKTHIGHAINKILKDVTVRCQAIQGKRVHYIPGWDCHGLPIELKALGEENSTLNPQSIRSKARQFANSTSKEQMSSFKHWGVLGDWENQCYYTYDTKYVINQLQLFWKMYEKGLIFRDFKPVYWSPSSQTALAESELVYKETHKSNAVTVQLKVLNKNGPSNEEIYLLVWTTTPWTLPSNQAVCFSRNISYSLVKIPSKPGKLFIIASKLVGELQLKLKEELTLVSDVNTEEISKLRYEPPFCKGEERGVLHGSHVIEAGTGLVHTAPAHGHDDFLIGLKHNLSKDCYVDEDGRFTSDLNANLKGQSVLDEGSRMVLDYLGDAVISKEEYEHSYPYDWRTDKPVLIRPSQQWFIDTDTLKHSALKCLKEVEVSENRLEHLIQSRPYWCLSRQRTWGVPIPAFFNKYSLRPLLSRQLIDHLCQIFERSGVDAWWTEPVQTLFPASMCREMLVRVEDVQRGSDIMDIWFDSGVSWQVLDGRTCDVCIEGRDQFVGWFQSSLLTSAAVRDRAPYRRLITHGFAVDDEGRKMSKSKGNVVDPETVTRGPEALGVDTLRWWVASHSHHPQIPVSRRILQNTAEDVQKLRITLRYILGALNGLTEAELEPCRLGVLDRYVLNACLELYENVMASYNKYTYNQVCTLLNNFIVNVVSGLYVNVIKDRLYCDPLDSERRRACRQVLHGLLNTLCYSIAPLLPHLAEEVFLHHPLYEGSRRLFFTTPMWRPPSSWCDNHSQQIIELALNVKRKVDSICGVTSQKQSCIVQVNIEELDLLKVLQTSQESHDSELTEILQVSGVLLKEGQGACEVSASNTTKLRCPRCRRYTAEPHEDLCPRCQTLVGYRRNVWKGEGYTIQKWTKVFPETPDVTTY